MAKKKAPKVEEPKRLTNEEMLEYDVYALKKRIYDLENDIVEASRVVHKRDKEISDLKFQICGYKLIERKEKIKDLEDRKLGFDKTVRERLEIKEDKFGYHPITGDIVLSK